MPRYKAVSQVQNLCKKLGWSRDEFIGKMRIAGIGEVTSRRIWEGETNIRVETAVRVSELLQVSRLDDLISITKQ